MPHPPETLSPPPPIHIVLSLTPCISNYNAAAGRSAGFSSHRLPVIEQDVWLPKEMFWKSHMGHPWILLWIPLEVIISPELWDTDT